MAQGFSQFCPRCGTATVPNQRVCARCGLDMSPWLSQQPPQPSSQPGYQPSQPGFQSQPDRLASEQSMQGPHASAGDQTHQAYGRPISQPGYPQASPGYQQPSQPGFQQGWGQSPPILQPFSQPASAGYGGYNAPQSAPGQTPRRRGRLVLMLLILLVVVVVGGVGYIGLHYVNMGNTTQSAITAVSLNSTVTYAGVTMTVLKVEQSQRFIDDPSSANDGMIRLHLQAQNKTTVPMNLLYNTIIRLVVPGGKTLTPVYVKGNIGIVPGKTQIGIVDFAVPVDTKINQLTLRIGATDEAQLDIPLIQGATLAQYTPKTTNLTGTFQYLGLDWLLVTATTQLSINGKQASKGMHYVTVMLKVNNTLSQTTISGSPYDYIRLKGGTVTATPVDTTLPVSFVAGANGKTGTVTFLVPDNATSLTLILLAQPQSGFDQATKDFKIA